MVLTIRSVALILSAFSVFEGSTLAIEGGQSRFLVTADELSKTLDSFYVVDVRSGSAYAAGHIPGAVSCNLPEWMQLASAKTGLHDSDAWSSLLGKTGIELDQKIVLVGDSIPNTCRIWWLLKYCGCEDVMILDGGFGQWLAAELKTSTEVSEAATTKPSVKLVESRLAMLADVVPGSDSKCQIVDNRSTEEFTGARGVGARRGHIPGAIHLEWKQFVDADQKFLSASEIKNLLQPTQ